MTVQLAIVGAFLSHFLTIPGNKIVTNDGNCIPADDGNWVSAFVIAITALKLLEIMTNNLFGKSIRAATELMIIEYQDGFVKKGIGYFSFRRQRSRAEYWISGMAPESLLLLFVISFCVLTLNIPGMPVVFILAGCCTVLSLIQRSQSVSRVFSKKDEVEKECQHPDVKHLKDGCL
jgi:hypothetical protein